LSIGPVIGNFVPAKTTEIYASMGTGRFEKGKSFQGVIARRQEFCDVEVLRVMNDDGFRP
jgi:hypothetical protein